MSSTSRYILPIIVTLMAMTAFALYAVISNVQYAGAAAPIFESNNSTTTRSTSASATVSYVACTGSCQLASIIVNQTATAGYVRVWNATSTATSTYQTTDTATATAITKGIPIAQIAGATDVGGTLIYDIAANLGLVIETSSGFDGEYTITYKR